MVDYNLKINNLEWCIKLVPTRNRNLVVENNECFGSCNYTELTIYLDDSLQYSRIKQTLSHELTHAYLHSYMIEMKENYNEENICEFVSLYSQHILDDCRKFMEFYRNEDEKGKINKTSEDYEKEIALIKEANNNKDKLVLQKIEEIRELKKELYSLEG